MTDNIIERLREYCDGNNDLMDAAANRIEELEGALREIAKDDGITECCGYGEQGTQHSPPECCGRPIDGFDRCIRIARAALGEKKDG